MWFFITNHKYQITDGQFSSCEIAGKPELSVRAVETHRENINRKTQTSNLVGLIKYSIQKGWVEGFYFAPVAAQNGAEPVMRSLVG